MTGWKMLYILEMFAPFMWESQIYQTWLNSSTGLMWSQCWAMLRSWLIPWPQGFCWMMRPMLLGPFKWKGLDEPYSTLHPMRSFSQLVQLELPRDLDSVSLKGWSNLASGQCSSLRNRYVAGKLCPHNFSKRLTEIPSRSSCYLALDPRASSWSTESSRF